MIPASFELGPHTWIVVWKKMKGMDGQCVYDDKEIRIHPKLKRRKHAEKDILVTLVHEVIHAVKYTMGELDHNEQEVDGLAHLFVQAFLTGKKMPPEGG